MRVASIDVGSNALRLLMLEFQSPQSYEKLGYERAPVRLCHQAGQLAGDAAERALEALARFRHRMESLGIEHYRAVATSAVRESEDRERFPRRAHQEAGVQLSVIDGAEEARLVHVAVCHRMQLDQGVWLLVDVGGGSVEVSLVNNRQILWSDSHAVGAVRLLEKAAGGGSRLLSQYVDDFASGLGLPSGWQSNLAGFIAVGGNMGRLAELSGNGRHHGGVTVVSVPDLSATIDRLSCLSQNQRVAELGLNGDRADVILPAALLYRRLAILAGASEIVVPNVGLREGVALDLVQELAANSWRAA